MKKTAFVLSIIYLLTGVASAASFQGLGYLDGMPMESYANAISDDGSTVVGISGNPVGESGATNGEAFRWTQSEAMVGIGDLPGGLPLSGAYCVSANGSVIGGGSNSTNGTNGNAKEAFRWTQSTEMVGLGYLYSGSHESTILGMSDDGSVLAGWGAMIGVGDQPFYWTEQTGMVQIGNLGGHAYARGISSDGNVIIGSSQSAQGNQGFMWTTDEGMVGLGDISGGIFDSNANGVNSDGSVIVGWGNSTSGQEAFRWTESGGMIGLGDLTGGGFDSEALDISANGSVVIGFGTTDLGQEAFIWNSDFGMRSVMDVLESNSLDLTGWTLTSANGISADGLTIIGSGINPDGFQEAWMATVPEPCSLLLIGLGGLMLRKRK